MKTFMKKIVTGIIRPVSNLAPVATLFIVICALISVTILCFIKFPLAALSANGKLLMCLIVILACAGIAIAVRLLMDFTRK